MSAPYGSIPFQGVVMPQPQIPMAQPLNTTLYVGNLDKTVTENILFERFSRYGKIVRFQIMRDRVRYESRGFAFIEFQNIKDAEAAKNQLNNEKLNNRYIRVMWKGDHKKSEPDANVFIRQIDPTLTQNDVESYFQKFGPILSTYLSVDERGDSNRYAYIQFRAADHAQKCLEGPVLINDQEVIVERFKTKSEREEIKENNRRNIYVRDLPEEITQDDIAKVVKGEFESVLIGKPNGTPAAFALIAFKNRPDAQAAIEQLNGAEDLFPNQTKKLFCSWHKSSKELKEERKRARDQDRDFTLYMRNLKPEIQVEDVLRVFKTLGSIPQWVNLLPFEATEAPQSSVKYLTQYGFIKMEKKDLVQVILGKKEDPELRSLFLKEKTFIDMALPKVDRDRMKNIRGRSKHQNFQGVGFPPYMMSFPPRYPMYQTIQAPWPMQMPQQMRGPYPPQRGGGPIRGRGRPQGPGQQRPRPAPGQYPNSGYQQGPPQHTQHQQRQPQQPRQEGPKPQQQQQPQPQDQPKKLDLVTIKKNWDNFKNLKAEDKRNILGELLYPKVMKDIGATLAPKITGMLVDFEVMTEEEVIQAIEDESILKQRISEAKEALEEADTN